MVYYHVFLTISTRSSRFESRLDLTEEQLKEQFIRPYHTGGNITTEGRTIDVHDIERIRIKMTNESAASMIPIAMRSMELASKILPPRTIVAQYVENKVGIEVSDEFITGPPGYKQDNDINKDALKDSKKVFVVHGRNTKAREALFTFLRSIGLQPLEWSKLVHDTGKTMPHITDILNKAFSQAHTIVVLITPDDEVRLREPFRNKDDLIYELDFSGQARPNVLFEAGMAMGNNPDKTIIVELGNIRPFSDIAGLQVIKLDDSTQKRQELANRLISAGCPVVLDGTDWHSFGDFEAAVNKEKKSDSKKTRYGRI